MIFTKDDKKQLVGFLTAVAPICCLDGHQSANEIIKGRRARAVAKSESSCSLNERETTSPETISLEEAQQMISRASNQLQPAFQRIDMQTQRHLRKILDVMREERVSSSTFLHADGYGHSDYGREVLDTVYAKIFSAESACVRIQYMSGTHAIASVLYGVLRPGDEILSVSGPVYDTLHQVLGTAKDQNHQDIGNLKDFGISTRILPLTRDGQINFDAIPNAINHRTKLIFIQRSFGYDWREPISLDDIKKVVTLIRSIDEQLVIFVDNCYGEFINDIEPTHESIGVDVLAGSLIKNIGGGIVPSGGYVVGKQEIVDKAKARLSAPGIGGGATLGYLKCMFQGLFMSPGIIGEALKSSLLIAEVMHTELGYEVMPRKHIDSFVRAIKLNDRVKLLNFCKAVQRNGPVGAFINPTVGQTDGYEDDVVFAQSTFIDGSTIELSADGAVREPYAAFAQGGLHWTHWSIVMEDVLQLVGRNCRISK